MSHVFESPGPVNINAQSGDRPPFLGETCLCCCLLHDLHPDALRSFRIYPKLSSQHGITVYKNFFSCSVTNYDKGLISHVCVHTKEKIIITILYKDEEIITFLSPPLKNGQSARTRNHEKKLERHKKKRIQPCDWSNICRNKA